MTRRLKAAVVALLMALALIIGVRPAAADEWDWLRVICAPWDPHGNMWNLLGCWQLPDDKHPPEG